MSSDELIVIERLPDDATDTIVQEVARAHGIVRYLAQMLRRNRSAPSMVYMAKIGQLVEPIDPELGTDPELPLGSAFIHGSLLGLRIVRACVAKADLEPLIDIGLSTIPVTGSAETQGMDSGQVQIASDFLDFGIEGYATVEDTFGRLVPVWDTELYEDDMRKHHFMHCGLGFPIALMAEVREQNAQIRQARAFDWNAALRDLS